MHWHQQWEIFAGVLTPGRNPVRDILAYTGVPEDLTGKTILDIGAWNGCFSAECIRRGASRVLGLGPDDPAAVGFDRIKNVLGYGNMEYRYGSVYDMNPDDLGQFDIVLCFGVLYHLRYPLLALDKIYEICRDQLFVESFVIDPHILLGRGHRSCALAEVHPELLETPLWQFYPGKELNNDASNWFGPNVAALTDAVTSAGFDITHTQTWGHRAGLAANRGVRTFMKGDAYECAPVIARSVGLSIS